MSQKITVGLSKKIGQPGYGSLGASCQVEINLDGVTDDHDIGALKEKARQAFMACSQAVHEELSRQQSQKQTNGQSTNGVNGRESAHSHSQNGNGSYRPENERSRIRLATSSQVRAIEAIAERQRLNLGHLLYDRFGVERPADLSIADASHLIDELKSASTTANGGPR